MLEKILKLCKAKGISMTALEKELGFGRATISKWKNADPSAIKLKKVADYFGVSVDYLISGEEEEDRTEEAG